MLEITKYTQEKLQDLVSCMEKLQDYIVKIDPLELIIFMKSYDMGIEGLPGVKK